MSELCSKLCTVGCAVLVGLLVTCTELVKFCDVTTTVPTFVDDAFVDPVTEDEDTDTGVLLTGGCCFFFNKS